MKKTLILVSATILLAACHQSRGKSIAAADNALEIKGPAECPYLTKDNKGNIVLSWIRMLNDSTTAFCYAISKDGKSFSDPIIVPNSNNIQPHGENLPKVVFKPSGEIIALWGAGNANVHNKYSGLVFYTQSFDEGKSWTPVRPLVTDTASYDQRYYDVAVLPNGEAGIVWLDNRKTTSKEGSALYFASTGGKEGFSGERLVSQPCCQCCRTNLYIDRKGGVHVIYRAIIQDSIRDMVHILSTNGGLSFSEPKRISEDNWVLHACPHTGPSMTDNEEGIHFAWFTGGHDKGCHYTMSMDDGNSFKNSDSVTAFGSHPQLISLPSGELVTVWDESRMVGNRIVRRIGIETRTADGISKTKDYVTTEGVDATYPVLCARDDKSILVAYTVKKGKEDFINYQWVTIN